MHFTEEQLNAIEEFAYRLYQPSYIAIALEVDPDDFKEDITVRTTDAAKAYYKGFLRQLDEVHTDTIKAARNGSNPAQIELMRYIQSVQREVNYG